MAIQHRRGNESDFVAGKMLPGELAVTTDGSKKAWIAFGAGDVKEFAFQDDIPLKISEIENDEEFIKNTVADLKNYYLKSETYTQEEINQLISVLPKYSVVVVDSLPLVGDLEKIYLLKVGDEEGNLFDEYIYVNSKWERIGSQRIDLSNYATKEEVEELEQEIDDLKGDLEELNEKILTYIDIIPTVKNGYYSEGEFYPNNTYETIEINCNSGERYKISGFSLGVSELPLVSFTNDIDTKECITTTTDTNYNDVDVIVPNGYTKMIVQGYIDSGIHLVVKKGIIINEKRTDISIKKKQGFYSYETNKLTFLPNEYYESTVLPCKKGEIYAIDCALLGATNSPFLYVADNNLNVINRSAFNTINRNLEGYIVKIPTDGLLVLSTLKSDTIDLKVQKLNLQYPLDGKKYIVFGDSITEVSERWRDEFKKITGAYEIKCYAVTGAHLRDFENTVLDGNPRSGLSGANTVCNQVYQMLTEVDNIEFIPDFILFSAGTNDDFSWEDMHKTLYDYHNFIDSTNNFIPFDSLNRTELDGAIRWQTGEVWTFFPKAKIMYVSPIHGAQETRSFYSTIKKEEQIKIVCSVLSCPVITAGSESGINGVYELPEQMGKYLRDGLHPNVEGGKVLGKYIANKVIDLIEY